MRILGWPFKLGFGYVGGSSKQSNRSQTKTKGHDEVWVSVSGGVRICAYSLTAFALRGDGIRVAVFAQGEDTCVALWVASEDVPVLVYNAIYRIWTAVLSRG